MCDPLLPTWYTAALYVHRVNWHILKVNKQCCWNRLSLIARLLKLRASDLYTQRWAAAKITATCEHVYTWTHFLQCFNQTVLCLSTKILRKMKLTTLKYHINNYHLRYGTWQLHINYLWATANAHTSSRQSKAFHIKLKTYTPCTEVFWYQFQGLD